MDFSTRSDLKELIDLPGIPSGDIERNMQELEFINTWLGGHAITLCGLKELVMRNQAIHVCEIGCGGGDNLLKIGQYCADRNISVQLTGVDWNRDCIAVAKRKNWAHPVKWIVADYRKVQFEDGGPPDIIFSSLFCHHFPPAELGTMLQWMDKQARIGWFINDLHRHPVAYYAIKWLTQLFSRSYLVKNDAPLSVLRGYTHKEWEDILKGAGVTRYSIKWKWAFRWLIISI